MDEKCTKVRQKRETKIVFKMKFLVHTLVDWIVDSTFYLHNFTYQFSSNQIFDFISIKGHNK